MPRLFLRIFAVAALGTLATFGTLAATVPAGAVTYTSCTSLSGINLPGHVETLGACSGPTGGSGVVPGPLVSPRTITWAGGGTSTIIFHSKVRVRKHPTCLAGSTEISLVGHAKSSTGPARSIRGMFFATICIDPNESVSLAPGKSVLLEQAR
jgi:hypothetical protein